jgi:hypothetical protein
MSKLRTDVDEALCGPPTERQVLRGERVRLVELAPNEEQSALTRTVYEHGAVAVVTSFEYDGPPDEAHRGAAIGVVRRAQWDQWGDDESSYGALYPRRLGEPAREIAWVSSLRRMWLEPPYGVRGAPKAPGWLERFLDAWLGPNAYERLRAKPCLMDARAWSPDVCPAYFAAGAEWWGTFLFTFQPTGAPRIVAMAASSTD